MLIFRTAAVSGCIFLSGCYATGTAPTIQEVAAAPLAPIEQRELTPAERIILAKGFASGLKDPDSAKFQWTKIPKFLPMDGNIDYCAMVNAKNSYGGYIGATPFIGLIMISKGKITAAAMGAVGDNDRRYADLLPKLCRDKGLDPFAVGPG